MTDERANQVAVSLTVRQIAFLHDVFGGLKPCPADRGDDRARQKLRRAGVVEFVKNPARWEITPFGNEVVNILIDKGWPSHDG